MLLEPSCFSEPMDYLIESGGDLKFSEIVGSASASVKVILRRPRPPISGITALSETPLSCVQYHHSCLQLLSTHVQCKRNVQDVEFKNSNCFLCTKKASYTVPTTSYRRFRLLEQLRKLLIEVSLTNSDRNMETACQFRMSKMWLLFRGSSMMGWRSHFVGTGASQNHVSDEE